MTDNKKVFVLGAGFTKAFLPYAPLMVDKYEIGSIIEKFKKFPYALRILELAKTQYEDGRIDIEQLMTRLAGSMPYDFDRGAHKENELLLLYVKNILLEKIEKAQKGTFHKSILAQLASRCVNEKIDCVTFNYDDVFDEALCKADHRYKEPDNPNKPFWHPDTGYGFYCRPSYTLTGYVHIEPGDTTMLLLKLHGSINWRVGIGHMKPYNIESLVHHERWSSYPENTWSSDNHFNLISKHLQADSFIVPPALIKSDLTEQPILRLTWFLAYKTLSEAVEIIFIGYSLPLTDLAAKFLFAEAIQPDAKITVVNKAETDEEKEKLKADYRKVFPKIKDDQFDFRDAIDWATEYTKS